MLREYNLEDSRLVLRLDEKLRLCDPYIEISKLWPIMIKETPFMTAVIDIMLLHEALKQPYRLVFPRKREHEAELLGGMTLEPEAGVHRNVLSVDFKSLYPTIIISFVLSPELMYLYQAWRASKKPLNGWVSELFGVDVSSELIPRKIPSSIPEGSSAEEKYLHWKEHFHDDVKEYVKFVHVITSAGITKYPFMAKQLKDLLVMRANIKKRDETIRRRFTRFHG